MGDSLTSVRLAAFADELEKQGAILDRLSSARSAIKGLLSRVPKRTAAGVKMVDRFNREVPELSRSGLEEAAKRVVRPLAGMRKGWTELSPRAKSIARATQQGTTLEKLTPEVTQGLKRSREAFELSGGALPETLKARKAEYDAAKKLYSETFGGAGRHLAAPSATLGEAWRGRGAKGIAEELSRRGWTGSGNVSKYLPSTGKSLMLGFPLAFDVPGVLNAPAPTRTGEGAGFERGLGAALGTAGMIAGVGTGLVPGTLLWYAANKAGSKAGRVIDRLRAGASIPEAVMAPSPEEAQSQLQNIATYYG